MQWRLQMRVNGPQPGIFLPDTMCTNEISKAGDLAMTEATYDGAAGGEQ
jgi:hypothetical protein